jgi:hypothetical protein
LSAGFLKRLRADRCRSTAKPLSASDSFETRLHIYLEHQMKKPFLAWLEYILQLLERIVRLLSMIKAGWP